MTGGFLLTLLLTTLQVVQEEPIYVPTGTEPHVDGSVALEEWADALELPLSGGGALFLKRSGADLFVGVRGNTGGFVSLGLASGDSLRILHASTGLITASYSRDVSGWVSVHGFRGPLRADGTGFPRTEVRRTEAYQLACYDQFGWTSNVVELGPPSDFEFRIRVSERAPGPLWLSVVMYRVQGNPRIARAPASLGDAALNPELLQGTASARLAFDVASWMRLWW